MGKRKKARPPSMLLWSRAEQTRLSEAVERIVSVSHDLAEQLDVLKGHTAAIKANATRRRKPAEVAFSAAAIPQGQEIVDLRNGTPPARTAGQEGGK